MTSLLTAFVVAQSPGFQVRQTTPLYSTQFWIIAGVGVAFLVGERQDDEACDARVEAETVWETLSTLGDDVSRETERRLRALREALTEASAQL